MKHSNGIVFIHGAGLNSSIWDELRKETDCPTLAIDFPNRRSVAKTNNTLTLEDYASAVTNQIKNWDQGNFVIVAHSIGALVGLKIAHRFKDRLTGFVAISSVVPKNGNSFVSSLPFPQKLILPVILRLSGTKPPRKSIESELCNDLTAEQTQSIVNGFTAEAKALYTSKVSFRLPDTERLYIKLTNDKSIPYPLQDSMAGNLNATKTVVVDSGHMPMMSKPKQLAMILSDFLNETIHKS